MTQLIASSGCLPSDNLFNTGSRNAAVLPVPVCATAIKSLPSSMIGIACSCIGVHSSNRLPRQAQSSGQCQAINQHYRTGWSALFPRVQRFLLEYVIRPKNRLSLLTNKIKE